MYVTTLRARLRCPALLLVVCVDGAVARWAATPLELGNPGCRFVPVVLGPTLVPVLTDIEQARRAPELAVLSAMAHGGDAGRFDVLDVLLAALGTVEPGRVLRYLELVYAALPTAARAHLEALMSTHTDEPLTAFRRMLEAKAKARGQALDEALGQALEQALGQARGQARAVLAVLEARALAVPDEARARIEECLDLAQLDLWVRRAVTVDTVTELFA